MTRGCYTTEMFDSVDAAEAHSITLIEQLAWGDEIAVRLISLQMLGPTGTA
jgi:hypothetical protein